MHRFLRPPRRLFSSVCQGGGSAHALSCQRRHAESLLRPINTAATTTSLSWVPSSSRLGSTVTVTTRRHQSTTPAEPASTAAVAEAAGLEEAVAEEAATSILPEEAATEEAATYIQPQELAAEEDSAFVQPEEGEGLKRKAEQLEKLVEGRRRMQPSYRLTFTCKPCERRSTHQVSKHSYYHGTVLITCPGCQSRHVISDHLQVRCLELLAQHSKLLSFGEMLKLLISVSSPLLNGDDTINLFWFFKKLTVSALPVDLLG